MGRTWFIPTRPTPNHKSVPNYILESSPSSPRCILNCCCICICICNCICTCIYVGTCSGICICMFIFICTRTCICNKMCMCVFISLCICRCRCRWRTKNGPMRALAIATCLNDGCDAAEVVESNSRGAEGAEWGGGRLRALHAPRLVRHAERASS